MSQAFGDGPTHKAKEEELEHIEEEKKEKSMKKNPKKIKSHKKRIIEK